jgi:hypothetical protein
MGAEVISFRPDEDTLRRITRASDRLGVSKNAVLTIMLAAHLARESGQPLPPDRQQLADAIIAAALAPDEEEAHP